MDENLSRGVLWNNAAGAGLALGAVSSAYLFATQYLHSLGTSVWISASGLLLWGIKFIFCIWLMQHFMQALTRKYSTAVSSDTFRLGMYSALCSALVYSAISLANVLIINPGLIHSQIEEALRIYGQYLDSNSLQALDKAEGMMPQIMFFSNLIYCFLYGTVLSAILSRKIPQRDPFKQ